MSPQLHATSTCLAFTCASACLHPCHARVAGRAVAGGCGGRGHRNPLQPAAHGPAHRCGGWQHRPAGPVRTRVLTEGGHREQDEDRGCSAEGRVDKGEVDRQAGMPVGGRCGQEEHARQWRACRPLKAGERMWLGKPRQWAVRLSPYLAAGHPEACALPRMCQQQQPAMQCLLPPPQLRTQQRQRQLERCREPLAVGQGPALLRALRWIGRCCRLPQPR